MALRMRQLAYARHFLLLGCFSALLIVLNRRQMLYQLVPSFALYGALHATALVLSLRPQSQSRSLPRKFAFILMSAFLSVLTLGVGMAGRQIIGMLPGSWGLYVLLGLSSFSGALAYGVLIRLFWIGALTTARLLMISVGCVLATLLAFYMLSRFTLLGRWWLPVLWWYALSTGLWCSGRAKLPASGRGLGQAKTDPRLVSTRG
jgi:hypothetical protein